MSRRVLRVSCENAKRSLYGWGPTYSSCPRPNTPENAGASEARRVQQREALENVRPGVCVQLISTRSTLNKHAVRHMICEAFRSGGIRVWAFVC